SETVRQCKPLMYQIEGIETPRCGSLARRAPPVCDIPGPTTQSLEPIPWSEARPSASSSPAVWRSPWPRPAIERQAAASAGPIGRGVGADALVVVDPVSTGVALAPAPPDPGKPLGVMTGASSR